MKFHKNTTSNFLKKRRDATNALRRNGREGQVHELEWGSVGGSRYRQVPCPSRRHVLPSVCVPGLPVSPSVTGMCQAEGAMGIIYIKECHMLGDL